LIALHQCVVDLAAHVDVLSRYTAILGIGRPPTFAGFALAGSNHESRARALTHALISAGTVGSLNASWLGYIDFVGC
jgi:hypothetical protein